MRQRLWVCRTIDLVIVLVLALPVKGNDSCPVSVDTPGSTTCLRPDDYLQNPREIPFRDLGASGVSVFASGAQVIVPSYTFQCCGTVTLWRTFMQPGGREDGKYDITFQVWRPSDSVQSTGCYILVGENTFRNIDLGSGGLVCEAPPAGSEIRVQPGDVVGFYSTHERGGDRGVQLDTDVGTETVWYAVDPQPSSDPQCGYSVGSESGRTLHTFTNHAPIFSVTLDAEECPEVTSSPTTNTGPSASATTTTSTSLGHPSNSASTTTPLTVTPPQHSPSRPTSASDSPTAPPKDAVSLATPPLKNSNRRGPNRKTKPDSTTAPLHLLSTEEIAGIVSGGVAVVVLSGTIMTVLLVFCYRKWRRKQVQKAIHTLVYETVDSSNVQISRESHKEDVTYDVLERPPTYFNLTDSSKQPPSPSESHTYYYIETDSCISGKQPSVTYYKQPKSIDEYDQPIILCDSHIKNSKQAPVVPYAVGNVGLHNTHTRTNKDCLSDNNDDTENTDFNIVSNEAYEVIKQ